MEYRRSVDQIRSDYFKRLASGEEKAPVHNFDKVSYDNPPLTPSQKARLAKGENAQTPAGGEFVRGKGIQPLTSAVPLTTVTEDPGPAPGTVTRGALVEDVDNGAIDPNLSQNDGTDANDTGGVADDGAHESLTGALIIPENWKDMAWNAKRVFAKNFTEDPVTNMAHANEIIEAEIARRAAASGEGDSSSNDGSTDQE